MKALLGLPEPCLHTAVLYKWQPVSCLDLTLLPGEQAPPSLGAVAWVISQTLFCLSPSVLLFFEGFGHAFWPLQSCSCVFSMWCLSTFPFTSPSLTGGNANTEKWPGRTSLLPQNISVAGGTLLFCVAVSFHLSRTASSFSGAYWRVSALLLLLSHHSFNKQVHLFCS